MADPIPSDADIEAYVTAQRQSSSPTNPVAQNTPSDGEIEQYVAKRQSESVTASPAKIPSDSEIESYVALQRQAKPTSSAMSPDGSSIGPATTLAPNKTFLQLQREENARVDPSAPSGTISDFNPLKIADTIGKAIPTPSAQDLQALGGGGDPGTAAKIGAGIFRGNANALGYVATLGPIMGAVSEASPLLGKLADIGMRVDLGAHLPDIYRSIKESASNGDEQGVAQKVAELGAGLWFATRDPQSVSFRKIAEQDPLVHSALSDTIRKSYSPEQLKDIYGRVNRNQGTPAEEELVKFINQRVESSKKAIKQGATTEQTTPRFKFPALNEFLGVESVGRVKLGETASAQTETVPATEEPSPTPIRQIEQRVQEQPPAQEAPVVKQSFTTETTPPAHEEAQGTTVPDYDPENLGARERIKKRQEKGRTRDEAVADDAETVNVTRDWLDANTTNGDIITTPDGGRWYNDHGTWRRFDDNGNFVNTSSSPAATLRGGRKTGRSRVNDIFTGEGASPVPNLKRLESPTQTVSEDATVQSKPEVTGLDGQSATGVQEILDLLPKSGLEDKVQGAISAFLATPVVQQLDLSNLILNIRDTIDLGGVPAGGTILFNVMELSRSDASPETFAHEMFHIIWTLLSPADKALVEKWRRAEIEAKYGKDAPVSLLSGNMTSSEAAQIGLPREDYHLINASEYLAHAGSDQFTKDHEADPEAQSFSQKVRAWLKALWDSIKQFFGADPTKEQFVRDILSGKRVTTPESGVKFEEKRASFRKTSKKAAADAELAATKEITEQTAKEQLAQTFDLVKTLEKNGAAKASKEAQKHLRYSDVAGISIEGEKGYGKPASYAELKAVSDEYQIAGMAQLGSAQFTRFKARQEAVEKKYQEKLKQVTSPQFVEKLAKLSESKLDMESKATNEKHINITLETAVKQAQKAMREGKKSELEIERLQGEIDLMRSLQKQVPALDQAMRSVVDALASTPEGIEMLTAHEFPSRQDIFSIYKDLMGSAERALKAIPSKRSYFSYEKSEGMDKAQTVKPQPWDIPMQADSIVKTAIYMLQRNEIVRDNVIAEHLMQDVGVAAQLPSYEAKLLADLKSSPAKTIMALRREGSRLATAAEKAKFVYRTRHKPLAKELDEFEALQEAADIGQKTLEDTEFRATVSEMDKDANLVGEQGPLKPNIDTSVMLPNGQRVDVSPAFFRGDMAAFQKNAAEMERAVGILKDWLLDPDNMDDRNYNSFVRTLAQLENNYIGVGMLDPNDRSKAVKYTFGILQNVVDKIAGRISIPARKALRKVDDTHRESARWIQKWLHQWQVSRLEAMQSHKLEWGSLTSTSYNDQNKWYYENVFNPLADSWNQEGLQGYKVGQTMPNGEEVTKADMDHLALNSEAIRDSFRALHRAGFDTTLELELGGHKMYRDPLQTSRNQTTHTFNRNRLQVGRDINELKNQEVEALKEVKDEAKIAEIKDQFRARQLEVLDKHWSDVGLDLMTGRSEKYAKPTFVDGRDGALIALRDEAKSIPSATVAIKKLAGLTSKTVEEVAKEMVPEWSRIILNWHRPASAVPSSKTMRAGDSENAFTRGREKTLAPGGFYDNGFRDARSVMNFASGMMSKATDEFIGALENAKKELIALRAKMVSEAKIQGVSEEKITSMQRVVRDTGITTDFYDDIDSRIKEVENTIKNLSTKELPADDPVLLDQAVAATLGLTLGTMTTVRNVLDGTGQIGRIGNQLMGSWIASQPWAIWYGFLMSRIPFYLNLARTGAVAGVKFGYGPILATVKAIKDPSQRGWRQFGLNALEPVMKELAVNAFNWVPHYSEMQRLGIVAPPKLIEKELTARFLGSLLQQGRIAGRNLTTAQKVGLALMSPLELYRFANSQVNPALGDAHFNSAAFAYFKGSLSPIKMHEAENRKQAQLEKDGKRPFNDDNPSDPVNLLTYQELLPKTFYRMISSQQGLSDVLELYSKAGIDLQKEAFLQRQAIRNGGDRELLTEAQLASLIRQVHADINIATFSGSPAFSRAQNPTTKSLRGFFGWQVRTLSNILNRFAIPMQTKSGAKNEKEYRNVKAGKWLFVMTMFFLPFLIYSALYNAWNRIENRKLTKLLYNKDLPGRAPWERDGAKSQAIGWAIEGLSSIPIIGTAIAAAMNDTSARASFAPNFIVLDHAKKLLQWASGVVQTGDLSYRTPELVMSLVPDSRIILSRLPGFEGKNDLGNAANLLRRYGPMDSMRPLAGPGSASVANELTPYGAKMANAAIKGDMQAFQEAYNEAVQVAKDLGKSNPEQVVKEMFRSRNPYSTVFKRKLTDDERQQILAKASPEERQAIEQVEQRFSQAAASLGSSASFTSEQAASNRSSRSNSPYTSMSEGRTGGASGAGSGLSGSASTRRTGSRFGGIRSRGASRSRLGSRRSSIGGRVKSSLGIGKGMRSRSIKSSKRRSLSLASLR